MSMQTSLISDLKEQMLQLFDDFIHDNFKPQSEGYGIDYIIRECSDKEVEKLLLSDLYPLLKKIKDNESLQNFIKE